MENQLTVAVIVGRNGLAIVISTLRFRESSKMSFLLNAGFSGAARYSHLLVVEHGRGRCLCKLLLRAMDNCRTMSPG